MPSNSVELEKFYVYNFLPCKLKKSERKMCFQLCTSKLQYIIFRTFVNLKTQARECVRLSQNFLSSVSFFSYSYIHNKFLSPFEICYPASLTKVVYWLNFLLPSVMHICTRAQKLLISNTPGVVRGHICE